MLQETLKVLPCCSTASNVLAVLDGTPCPSFGGICMQANNADVNSFKSYYYLLQKWEFHCTVKQKASGFQYVLGIME